MARDPIDSDLSCRHAPRWQGPRLIVVRRRVARLRERRARAGRAPRGGAVRPALAAGPRGLPRRRRPSTPPADLHEEVLRRLLRSGCRDGLHEARDLAASGGATWAATVARLCGEILRDQARAFARASGPHAERDGRGTLVIASTIYGIWAGIAFDVLFTIDGVRTAIVPPLLGMGAGLALSLAITGDRPLTNGQAWSIVTGLEYGSFNGAFWAGGFGLGAHDVVATTLVAGLAAGAAGLLVANQLVPTQGEVEVVRSGLLWGTVAGMLGVATFAPNSSDHSIFRAGGRVHGSGVPRGPRALLVVRGVALARAHHRRGHAGRRRRRARRRRARRRGEERQRSAPSRAVAWPACWPACSRRSTSRGTWIGTTTIRACPSRRCSGATGAGAGAWARPGRRPSSTASAAASSAPPSRRSAGRSKAPGACRWRRRPWRSRPRSRAWS